MLGDHGQADAEGDAERRSRERGKRLGRYQLGGDLIRGRPSARSRADENLTSCTFAQVMKMTLMAARTASRVVTTSRS